jgi:hypothetical protein
MPNLQSTPHEHWLVFRWCRLHLEQREMPQSYPFHRGPHLLSRIYFRLVRAWRYLETSITHQEHKQLVPSRKGLPLHMAGWTSLLRTQSQRGRLCCCGCIARASTRCHLSTAQRMCNLQRPSSAAASLQGKGWGISSDSGLGLFCMESKPPPVLECER